MDGPSLNIVIGANLQKLQAEMQKANGMLKGFGDKAEELTKTLVGAFAIERVGEFTVEITKLAGQSAGVKAAFDQLHNSAQVLNEMKSATQGTVSELDLMKSAVQANNFNIPLDQMGKLFEFAHQRAIATGQSVDYLVQSIVTGIGRKSPLILDNLGISAIALKEKMKGVGTETATVGDVARAVGEIAEESLNKFGRAAETTASRMEKMNANWENFKVALGDAINRTGVVDAILEKLSRTLNLLSKGELDADENLENLNREIAMFNNSAQNVGMSTYQKMFNELGAAADRAGKKILVLSDGTGKVKAMLDTRGSAVNYVDGSKENQNKKEELDLNTIAGIEQRIKDLRDKQLTAHGALIHSIELEVIALQKKEKLLKDGPESKSKVGNYDAQIKGIQSLRMEMEKLAAAAQQANIKTVSLESTLIKLNSISNNSARSIANLDKWIVENTKKNEESAAKNREAYQQQLQTMQQVGSEIGSQLGAVMSGHQSFASAMARITADMVQKYAMQAIAGAGAKAVEGGGIWAVGLAAAAMAAMSALFGSYGISSGGGGGGGGSSLPRAADQNKNASQMNTPGLHINLGGNFKLQGNTLVAAIRKADYNASKTGG